MWGHPVTSRYPLEGDRRIPAPFWTSYALPGNEMRDFPLPHGVLTTINQHRYKKDKGMYWSWAGTSKLSSQISLFSSRLVVSGMCCHDGKLTNTYRFSPPSLLYLLPLAILLLEKTTTTSSWVFVPTVDSFVFQGGLQRRIYKNPFSPSSV